MQKASTIKQVAAPNKHDVTHWQWSSITPPSPKAAWDPRFDRYPCVALVVEENTPQNSLSNLTFKLALIEKKMPLKLTSRTSHELTSLGPYGDNRSCPAPQVLVSKTTFLALSLAAFLTRGTLAPALLLPKSTAQIKLNKGLLHSFEVVLHICQSVWFHPPDSNRMFKGPACGHGFRGFNSAISFSPSFSTP